MVEGRAVGIWAGELVGPGDLGRVSIAIFLCVAAGVGNVREGEEMVTKEPYPVLPE